ncbi:TraB/GumN family protein [Candidatus Viadribacter manganicus]|nr:TraB/GumN family protein [Candidatus Viadribacter manganicus]
MIKHWVFAAALTFAGFAHADEKPQPAPAAPAAAAAPAYPALFVARDADSTLYLFGTMHIRRPGGEWGGPVAQAALAEADEVWTEMEIAENTQSEVQALVLSAGMAPADRPLSSWLNKDQRAELAAALQHLGASPAVFERMRPWLAAMTLSVMPLMQQGYDPAAGADRAVIGAAGDARQRAFETAAEQIGFFANLSDTAQRQYLMDTINTATGGSDEIDQLSHAWESGDLERLETLVLDSFRARYPELHQVIFTQRNHNWTETLVAELDGAGVDFVAVGAGHLLGDDGVVALLRARGVDVERAE